MLLLLLWGADGDQLRIEQFSGVQFGRVVVGEALDLQRLGSADERGQRLVLDVHLAAVDERDQVLQGRVRDIGQYDWRGGEYKYY